jgi:2-iminobutanoate/2-iminopropanoate deaminase
MKSHRLFQNHLSWIFSASYDKALNANSQKQIVSTSQAPRPLGPYSQGIAANGFVYTAGQGAIDPVTNEWRGGSIQDQTRMVLDNIKAILQGAGSGLENVVKVSVFLKNKQDFGKMNEVYKEYFPKDPPARTTVVTDLLRDDMLVEIDAVATG